MNELWIQCFTCCVTQQPQPTRRRIDMSMIGKPTNFRHTAHIGSTDAKNSGTQQLSSIQQQMASKGGYHYAVSENNHPITVGGDNYGNR